MAKEISVTLKSLNNEMTFAAKGPTGHWTMMDAKADVGGNAGAASPMELVLEALGGCTGLDTISILKKKRTPFSHLDINIKGDRTEEHPKVYTHIHMEFILYSNDGEKALKSLKRAVALSHDKYCSVAAMLKNSVEISHECNVVEE